MCIESYKVSSSSSSSSSFISPTLNPSAREWRPNPQNTPYPPPLQSHQLLPCIIFPPHYPPPPSGATAVQVLHPSYRASPASFSTYQGFVLYGPCKPLQHFYPSTTDFRPPNESFYSAATPISGGGAEIKAGEKICGGPMMRSPKSPMKLGRKNVPLRLRMALWSFNVEKKAKLRQEWRPRKSDGAASSPPWGSLSKPPFVAKEVSPSMRTTVMIKNIPNQLRRDFMLEFLDNYCRAHLLEYDFMYLPMDFRKMDNLGYCFVNFTSGDAAHKFKKILQNYKWEDRFTSKKICEISWARIQGKEGLLKRFQDSTFACDRVDFLPVVLDPPRNGLDPKPAPPVILGKVHTRVSSKNY
ncbi:hypothetical protein OROGR_016651 [Orobanche gracilis]